MPNNNGHFIGEKIKLLVSEVELDSAVRRIADEIDSYSEELYEFTEGKKLLLLGILKGSVVFMGDLLKKVKAPLDIDFMKVASTGDDGIEVLLGLTENDISDKDIIVIEDIIDSGRTVSRLKKYLLSHGASSVKTCTLLDKPSKRETCFTPDFVGFEIPDEYVVGYGLDYEGQYRALPYIGVLV